MEQVVTSFFDQLAATSEGRQHLLSIAVDAEEGDEGAIFDQLQTLVDEPKLKRLVQRHQQDEVRHAQLFRDCLARLGLEKRPLPDELKLIRQIGLKTGRADQPLETSDDIVRTYALLLAIEERGVEQFPAIAAAFERVDAETAETYRQVASDEQRHTRYCETIGRRYAASEDAWQQAVAEARELESEAFAEAGVANFTYCASEGLLTES
jgi:rubrerythrin